MLKWLDLVDERNHSLVYKSLLPQQGHINVNPVFPAFHLLFSLVGGKLMIGCIVEKWWLGISWSVRQNFYYDFFKLYVILRARLGDISVKEKFKNKTKLKTIHWLPEVRYITWIMIQNMSICVCNTHTHN